MEAIGLVDHAQGQQQLHFKTKNAFFDSDSTDPKNIEISLSQSEAIAWSSKLDPYLNDFTNIEIYYKIYD